MKGLYRPQPPLSTSLRLLLFIIFYCILPALNYFSYMFPLSTFLSFLMGGRTGLVCSPPLAAPLQVLVERGEVVASCGQLSIEHKENVYMYLMFDLGESSARITYVNMLPWNGAIDSEVAKNEASRHATLHDAS